MAYRNEHITNLLEKEAENRRLTAQVQALSNENITVSSELSRVTLLCHSLISKESNYALIQSQLVEKEAEIIKLKEEVHDLTRAYNDTQFKSKLQYEKDVSQVKYQQENNAAKVDNAAKIEKLNEAFYSKILELEGLIIHFKQEEQKRVDSLELKHQNQIASFKKKMIDYLKSNSSSKKQSLQNSDLNSKLANLHINELINELEFQSCLIESLIQENTVFKKKIAALTNDIKIHCEVESCLCEKNKKFQKQLQIISQPVDAPLSTGSNNMVVSTYQSKSFYHLQKGHHKSEDITQSRNAKMKKDLITKDMQIEAWKTKYVTVKSKLEMLNRRYAEVMKLCDEALKEVNLRQETKGDELYLSLDEFKQCDDFAKMTPKQRYAALVIIIKYILPLVSKEVIINGALNTNVDHIKTIVHFDRNQTGSKRIPSESDYRLSSVTATSITETGHLRNKHQSQIKYSALSELQYKVKKPSIKIANNRISFSPFSVLKVSHV